MILEGVDLAVEELALKKRAPRETLEHLRTQSKDGKKALQVSEPVGEGLAMHPHAELARRDRGRGGERMEAVVLRKCLDDDAKREALVLRDERREGLPAMRAEEELDGAVLVLADAVLGDALSTTVRTREDGFRLMQ